MGTYYSLLSEYTTSSFCFFVLKRSLCLYWPNRLLKVDEAGGVAGSVHHRLVGDRELAQVVANNLGLGFHLGEGLARPPPGQDDLQHLRLLFGPCPQAGPAQVLLPQPQGTVQPRHCVRVSSAWPRCSPKRMTLQKVRCCFCSTSAILLAPWRGLFFFLNFIYLGCAKS